MPRLAALLGLPLEQLFGAKPVDAPRPRPMEPSPPEGVPRGPDSLVQQALKGLHRDEVLIMQLEPGRPRDPEAVLLRPGSTVHIDRLVNEARSGRLVVGRVIQPKAATEP